MKHGTLGELVEALGSAGFELVSFREETYRHLALEQGLSGAVVSGEIMLTQMPDKTGSILLEIKAT
jgi:hypothetical protein